MVTWVLAWVAHQLPRAPAHLFDANIFYPERNTLAFSETLLVPGAIVAPLHWLGVGAILIYNLVFLSGFALSGVGVALLVRRLTRHDGAAMLAGIVFAFPPYRIDHYAHLQLQQTQFIPLSLWAFHVLLDRGRLRDGVRLGVFVACQLLSCMYYGLFLVPYMAVVCGTMLIADRRMHRQRAVALAAAAIVLVIAVIPVGRVLSRVRSLERGRAEVAAGSATWPPSGAAGGHGVRKVFARSWSRPAVPGSSPCPGHRWAVAAVVGDATGVKARFDPRLRRLSRFNGVIYRARHELSCRSRYASRREWG
jgi:hypothetical protein